MTVLEFLEKEKNLPAKVTVRRTTLSSFLFYSVVRRYRAKTHFRPEFIKYSKGQANQTKALLEEHGIWGEGALFVLEGFSKEFVDALELPSKVFVVAETDDGELEADKPIYRNRRGILRVLLEELRLDLSLRELLKMDWSRCEDFAEYEVLLRRAKVLGWDEERIAKYLEDQSASSFLNALRAGKAKDLTLNIQRIGEEAVIPFLIKIISQTLHYNVLKMMGVDQERIERELGAGWRRVKELEDWSNAWSQQQLRLLAQRTVEFERKSLINLSLANDLLLLNSKMR